MVTVSGSYQSAANRRIGASHQLAGGIPPAYCEGLLDDHAGQFTAAASNGDTSHDTTSNLASPKGELDFGKDDAINFLRDETCHQFAQELRMQSPTGGTPEFMAGLVHLDNHGDSTELQLWMVPAFPPAPAPISCQLFDGPFTNRYVQDADSYAAFAPATWHLAERMAYPSFGHGSKAGGFAETDAIAVAPNRR